MLNCLLVGLGADDTVTRTFSLETAELIKSGSVVIAIIYVIASIAVGVLAVMLPSLVLK